MFWISFIVTILLGLESFKIFKSNLKNTSLRIALITLIFIVINFLMLYPSLKVNYSSTIYLLNALTNNPIITILWILINLALYVYLIKTIIKLKKRKKQNQKIFLGIFISYSIYNILLIFILFNNLMSYILLIGLIGSIILLVKNFLINRHNYLLVIILILGLFTYYSYFTYGGSARLQIVFMGYPISAYDTGLEELSHLKEKNVKQFYPIKNIPVESGDMGIILVRNHFGLKIGRYVGF